MQLEEAVPSPAPLWRHLVGGVLRRRRRDLGLTLVEAGRRAGVSPQYLSEMERGAKDPSSEMVAAVAGALGLDLLALTEAVGEVLRELTVTVPGSGRPVAPIVSITSIGGRASTGPVLLAA